MDDIYSSPAYKRSRTGYNFQAMFEYFIALLVSDAYLAKLLADIGLDDSLIGILSSFIAAAFLFELVSIPLVGHMTNVKRTVIFFNVFSSVLFCSLFFIPLLPFSKTAKTVLVVLGIVVAYFCLYLVATIQYKWANSFVKPENRASFSASKEMMSLVGGMLFTLAVGFVIDYYEGLGNLHGGFLFVAIAGLVFTGCSFVSLMLIARDAPTLAEKPRVPMKTVLKNTLGRKEYRNVVLLYILWQVGCYLSIGFLGVYKIKDLALSVGMVQVINIIGNLFRFAFSRPFGAYSDKHSFAIGIELGMLICVFGFAAGMLTTPDLWWLIAVWTVLYNIGLAGTTANFRNVLYSYVPADYYSEARAIMDSLGGILGFAASLLGGVIVDAVQKHGLSLFGMPIYGQQVLCGLSAIVLLIAFFFSRKTVSKFEIMVQ